MRGILIFLQILTLLTANDLSAQIDRVVDFYRNAEKAAGSSELQVGFVPQQMQLVDNYNKLSQIMLIRHGEPALKKKGWVKRSQAIDFTYSYDTVGIYTPSFIPAKVSPNDVDIVQTSSINRARHTATLIFGDKMNYAPDSLFREFERKIFGFPNMKLPLKFWLGTSRVLWIMGMNKKGIESFHKAKSRSRLATDRLEELAEHDKKVILVAHGFLNRHLVKNLKKRGWSVVRNGGNVYLATWLLVRYDD